MSANLQSRMNKLKPYFIGMRVVGDGLIVVDTLIKENWVIPDSNSIDVSGSPDQPLYKMFHPSKANITIDDILDHVENMINLNMEREQKLEFLKAKYKELQQLFRQHSLSKLRTLKFVFGDSQPIVATSEESFEPQITLEDISTVTQPIQTFSTDTSKPKSREELMEEYKRAFREEDPDDYVYANPQEPSEVIVPQTNGVCNHGPDVFCDNCM